MKFGPAVPRNALEVLPASPAFVALRRKLDILWVVLAGAAVSAAIL